MTVGVVETIGQRVVTDLTIPCPAGEAVGETLQGAACNCRVTKTLVASATDPSSLGRFCTSADGYLLCPVWQDEKQRVWDAGDELPT